MVFRKDSKVDAFQRQISALRHQLGNESDDGVIPERGRSVSLARERDYLADQQDFPSSASDRAPDARGDADSLETRLLEPSRPPIPAIDTHTSVIAHSTAWSGDLESTGSLHIHGRVEGSVSARDTIFIAEEADVEAVIRAANVTVAGTVRGSVHCAERFEVLPHGKVSADIHAPAIAIHEGAVVAGEVSMAPAGDTRAALGPPARVARGGD